VELVRVVRVDSDAEPCADGGIHTHSVVRALDEAGWVSGDVELELEPDLALLERGDGEDAGAGRNGCLGEAAGVAAGEDHEAQPAAHEEERAHREDETPEAQLERIHAATLRQRPTAVDLARWAL
jgi:hypothetical protein